MCTAIRHTWSVYFKPPKHRPGAAPEMFVAARSCTGNMILVIWGRGRWVWVGTSGSAGGFGGTAGGLPGQEEGDQGLKTAQS